MPDVRPFRAWRYDTSVAGPLDDLICPPYDVIASDAARRLLARNAHNAIHLELGPGAADPAAPDNRYAHAAATLDRWMAGGIIRRDAAPCLYVYEQRFTLGGEARRRLAFFAAVRLSPWEAGAVLPHEVTFAAPKADRLALLEATRCNVSPIYALCDGALPGVTALLESVAGRAPDAAAGDEADEQHRLWAVSDTTLLQRVMDDLAARPLIIADGHHRYETALAYAQAHGETTDRAPDGGEGMTYTQAHRDSGGPEGAGYVLMAISPVDDPGLAILPTHRLLRDLDAARWEHGLAHLREYFDVAVVENVPPEGPLLSALAAAAHDHAIGLYTPGLARLLRPRHEAAAAARRDPALRALDAALLQALLFERLLAVTPADLREQRYVDYTRDAAEAIRLVDGGSHQAAALLNGTAPAALLEIARAGARMPQKSTYFYPKLATGLVLRRLDS